MNEHDIDPDYHGECQFCGFHFTDTSEQFGGMDPICITCWDNLSEEERQNEINYG